MCQLKKDIENGYLKIKLNENAKILDVSILKKEFIGGIDDDYSDLILIDNNIIKLPAFTLNQSSGRAKTSFVLKVFVENFNSKSVDFSENSIVGIQEIIQEDYK